MPQSGRRLPGKQAGWPVWSSDGGAVAYTVDDRQSIRVESMDGSTGGRTLAVDHGAIPVSWSPNDQVITLYGQVDAVYQLGFLDASGAGEAEWLEDVGRNACGELFYRRGDSWMSVEIQTEPELTWSAPRLAFETDFVDTAGRSYDLTSDGQKLYVIKQPNPPDGSRIHVITNWRGQP